MSLRAQRVARSVSESSLVRAVRDEQAVVAAYSARTSLLALPGTPRGIRAWRLFAQKDGGFVVAYSFRYEDPPTSGRRADSLFDVYADIDPEGSAAVSQRGEFIEELQQVAWRLPHDPRFPELSTTMTGEVLSEHHADGAKSPRILAYRPRVRATLRFECANRDPIWARLSASKNRYARVLSHARIGARLSADDGTASGLFPAILAELPECNGVLLEHVAGIAMHDSIADLGSDRIEATADAVVRMFRSAGTGLNARHGLDEAEQTSWTLRRAARWLPGSFHELESDLATLFDVASELSGSDLGVVHRDLHDKQVMFTPTRRHAVTLLDSDTLALGDRALDVANLAAHFELRELQGLLPAGAGAALADSWITACGRAGHSIASNRLAFFLACSFLRLAGVYALRSTSSRVVEGLLSRGRAALARTRNPS